MTAKPSEHQTEKRPFVPVYDEHQTRSKVPKTSNDTSSTQSSPNLIDLHASTSVQPPAQAATAAAMNADQPQLSHQPRDKTSAMFSNVVNNNNIATWITDKARSLRPSASAGPLPTSSRELRPSTDIEAQVSQILATTAHHLTAGKQNPGDFQICKTWS